MDLTSIVTLYGKPVVKECPQCEAKGCEYCKNFGYIAQTDNKDIIYTFDYPVFIDQKKRGEADFIKRVSIAVITILFVFSIIISYIINIANHG